MTIRKASMVEINAAFEAYRARAGRPLTFIEVNALDDECAQEIERDEKKDITQRLAFMMQGIEAQDGFNWNEYQQLCSDALSEILRLRDVGLTHAAQLTTAEAFTIPNLKTDLFHAQQALITEGMRADRLASELELELERKLPDPATCQHDFTGRCNNIDGSEQIFCRKCGINP